MPDILVLIFAGIFLPVFPLSIVFNFLLEKAPQCWIKVIIVALWPLIGLFIIYNSQLSVPGWIMPVALFTSVLYALRMLSLREVNQWAGFLATSIWSLLWIAIILMLEGSLLYVYAFSMTVPLLMLIVLSKGLEDRYGAAYTGLYGGLARTIPRFSGILVAVVIAAVATPLFPTFFFMFELVVKTVTGNIATTTVVLINWLLWSWAGARLIQGLIVGRASVVKIVDMEMLSVVVYSMLMLALLVAGLYLGGVIL